MKKIIFISMILSIIVLTIVACGKDNGDAVENKMLMKNGGDSRDDVATVCDSNPYLMEMQQMLPISEDNVWECKTDDYTITCTIIDSNHFFSNVVFSRNAVDVLVVGFGNRFINEFATNVISTDSINVNLKSIYGPINGPAAPPDSISLPSHFMNHYIKVQSEDTMYVKSIYRTIIVVGFEPSMMTQDYVFVKKHHRL